MVYFSARARSEKLKIAGNLGYRGELRAISFRRNGSKSLGRPKQSSVASRFAAVLF